jgi:hypothetical protein
MFFEKKSTKIISLVLVVAVTLTMMMPAIAEEPFISYGYDWWWETYPVQSGYVVERVITSNELGLTTPLRSPQDVFIYESSDTGEIMVFIVDSGNNRIVITDENFGNIRILDTLFYRDDYRVQNFLPDDDSAQAEAAYWAQVDKIRTTTTLNDPQGIHVTEFQGETRVYIADHNNERVLAADLDGGIWMEYTRPITDTWPEDASFNPSKVLTDNAGNVYICIKTITRGAVVFSEAGIFRGYFGANRVTQTAEAILNYFLRFVLSREAMRNRGQPPPVEFSNFTIDDEQFIYTVTQTRSATVDIVTKLNPAGQNIFAEQGYDDFIWGDFTAPYVYGRTYQSMMVDISVDANGDIYLFDRESGKVFQYDKEGHLMFIFGGRGNQKGLFTAPAALETHEGRVYALDSTKNSITVFKLTEFGELVIDAMSMFNRGLYAESMGPWEEVLRRDANYYMASVGMGNAKLSVGEFEEALNYFYKHSLQGYARAFKDFRINYIRDNFDIFLAIALVAVALLIGGNVAVRVVKKRKLAKEMD